MTEMKFKELHDAIEAILIKELGVTYINLNKHTRCALISHKYLEMMQALREEQE